MVTLRCRIASMLSQASAVSATDVEASIVHARVIAGKHAPTICEISQGEPLSESLG